MKQQKNADRLTQLLSNIEAIEAALPEVMESLKAEVSLVSVCEADAAPEEKDNQDICILLVDDDPTFRLLTKESLVQENYQVLDADDGDTALTLAHQHKPDLILLDALMGDKNGFDVCAQLLKIHDLHNTPVLMMTCLEDTDSVQQAFEAGAIDYVTKPVNYPVLLQRIRYQLRASKDARILRESQERLLRARHMAGLGYWCWNAHSDSFTLSGNLAKLLNIGKGVKVDSLQDFLALVEDEDRDFLRAMIADSAKGSVLMPTDYRLQVENNPPIILHQKIDVLPDFSHLILGTVQDITQQRSFEQHMGQLVYTDELTGLPSRAYFYKHLENVINASHRRNERFALMYLDLDGFKDINDSLGHDVGDELLKTIGKRLHRVLRNNDFVARLSGDEFCIMVENVSDEYAAADVANRCLQATNQPLFLGSQEVRPRCSIGISHFPEDATDLQGLLKAADSAMYAAKEDGRHRYAFYKPELTAKAERRLQMEQKLRLAIDREQLELHYQPQIELGNGQVMGVEALVRWRHPDLGLVSPVEFIGVAEKIGLIKPLGEWVLNKACQQAQDWLDQGLPPIRMAVNISPLHFNDPSLLKSVKQILLETGFPAKSLELEITESVVQTNKDNFGMFKQLRDLGVKIAIDDFGTGYSSLSSLNQLPIDCLKIDKLFIDDMLTDRGASLLLGTIIGMARALGCKVVAEGVELEDQVMALKGMGCDIVQGFFLSRPVVAEAIPPLLETRFLPNDQQNKLLTAKTDFIKDLAAEKK